MQVIYKIKTCFIVSLTAMTLLLAGCQTPSNNLTFTPPAPTASMNIYQTAIVNVNAVDSRQRIEIADYVRSGELIKLTASPTLTELFQQVMQQNLISKGFRISQVRNANSRVTVDIKEFYTQVDQGNLRYRLTTKIKVNVSVQGVKGQYNKTFNASDSQSGVFNAGNDEIQKVQTRTFNEIVKNIYQDQEIATAINQYAQ